MTLIRQPSYIDCSVLWLSAFSCIKTHKVRIVLHIISYFCLFMIRFQSCLGANNVCQSLAISLTPFVYNKKVPPLCFRWTTRQSHHLLCDFELSSSENHLIVMKHM